MINRPLFAAYSRIVVCRYFLSNASKINLKVFWDFGTRVAKESADHWYLAAPVTWASSCKDLLRVYEWPRTNGVTFLRSLCTGPGAMATVVGANDEYDEVLVTWDMQLVAFTGVRHVIVDGVAVTRLVWRQIVLRSYNCCIVKKQFSVRCVKSRSHWYRQNVQQTKEMTDKDRCLHDGHKHHVTAIHLSKARHSVQQVRNAIQTILNISLEQEVASR